MTCGDLLGFALIYLPTAPYICSLRTSSRNTCSTFVSKIRTRPKRERPLGPDRCLEERPIEAAAGHPLGPPVRQGYKNAVNWFGAASQLVRTWFGAGSQLAAGQSGCNLHLGRGCFYITTGMEEEEEDKANAARAPIPAEHIFAVVLAGIATTVPTHRP